MFRAVERIYAEKMKRFEHVVTELKRKEVLTQNNSHIYTLQLTRHPQHFQPPEIHLCYVFNKHYKRHCKVDLSINVVVNNHMDDTASINALPDPAFLHISPTPLCPLAAPPTPPPLPSPAASRSPYSLATPCRSSAAPRWRWSSSRACRSQPHSAWMAPVLTTLLKSIKSAKLQVFEDRGHVQLVTFSSHYELNDVVGNIGGRLETQSKMVPSIVAWSQILYSGHVSIKHCL